MNALVSVQNLRVEFGSAPHRVIAVDGLSFDLHPGECLALVGESGSGKSVTARTLIGLAGSGARVSADRLTVNGRPILESRQRQLRSIRGKEVGLVLQDALVSLDPLRPIGREIDDSLRLHTSLSPAARRERVIELLASVRMPDPEHRMLQRSGELSGGLRQRALIASAIALNPGVLIADEPTTALDVTIQAQILDLLGELKGSGTALLLISHDLAVVSDIADRVAVMQDGRIVEQGATAEVLGSPQHPYTRALIAAVPAGRGRGERLSVEVPRAAALFHDAPASVVGDQRDDVVLHATDLSKQFTLRHGRQLRAVDEVSLQLRSGRTLGLVGESGSGKTTVARMILGLTTPDAGTVTLLGDPWSGLPESQRRPRRKLLGGIYQDPLSSFDPRFTVDQVLTDAVTSGDRIRDGASRARVTELLDAVGLPGAVRHRRPLHLSGGQRQRVAIARALAANPRIIVCDEPVSALDVSVQAQVLDLLTDLQSALGLSYLFISHDLGVVQHMSDTVAVMRDGRIVEQGVAAELFASPTHEYTRQLMTAAPRL
jgi:peptide/nickel transport system ATP-binding protein